MNVPHFKDFLAQTIDQLGFEPFAEAIKTDPKKNPQKLKRKKGS